MRTPIRRSLATLCCASLILTAQGAVPGVGAASKTGPSRPGARSATPAIPNSIAYKFTRGPAERNRLVHVTMIVQRDDPLVPESNGSYAISLDTRFVQFVVGFDKKTGFAKIENILDGTRVAINGTENDGAFPTYSATKSPTAYFIYVSPYGTCVCAGLPPVIYAASGSPNAFYPGDLFNYLHPFLPADKATLKAGWSALLPFYFTPGHQAHIDLVSKLVWLNNGWVVVSHAQKTESLTLPLSEWTRAWGKGWQHPLPYGGPVTVTLSVKLDSSLSITPKVFPGLLGAGAKPLGNRRPDNSYSAPLEGSAIIDFTYSQGGRELQKVSRTASLSVKAAASKGTSGQ